jgi:ubiquinone/menaquinone biosynthesis C-methylase UbiE
MRVISHGQMAERTVIAADISGPMLAIAERRLGPKAARVRLLRLDAEAMPEIADASVDAYSLSLVMKICDRKRALAEAIRVLRPGGRLVILEASNIRWRTLHRASTLKPARWQGAGAATISATRRCVRDAGAILAR